MENYFSKLRTKNPLYYKILALLVLLAAITGLFAAYYFYVKEKKPVTLGEQTSLDITTYSFNGEVVSISGNTVTVKVATVKTTDGQGIVSYENKTINVTAATGINKVSIAGGKTQTVQAHLSDIAAGQNVAIYTPNDPKTLASLEAERIDIIEQ